VLDVGALPGTNGDGSSHPAKSKSNGSANASASTRDHGGLIDERRAWGESLLLYAAGHFFTSRAIPFASKLILAFKEIELGIREIEAGEICEIRAVWSRRERACALGETYL
jgi:hypothetical protein